MAYQKQTWVDYPDLSSPITADRLNHMEDGIADAWEHGGGGAGDSLKIGAIIPFTGTTAPNGYMICDGTAISRTEYAELFSVIGTTFGSGDGSTTFNIPNLKGKVPVGLDSNDTDFDTIGETGGSKELQEHNHKLKTGFDYVASSGSNTSNYVKKEGVLTANFYTENAGTGNSGNLQPYIVINYIIKATEAQTGEVLSETLPVGSEIDFDGETVPSGWEQVNGPNDYSTTEIRVGTWINGKPLYRKVYDFGSAPNNTTKTVSANITNLSAITKIYGFAVTSAGYVTPLPQVVANGQNQIQLFFNNSNVSITTTSDKSSYYCYVILEYTKTTD